ncbi:MAG: hypothetical protein IK119_04710, partial [Bacteroidales bacterium]|nr:hypothetical protein [Bacteroidales bacterium]
DGYPNHVYSKGKDGNMVFYSTADCIYYITLYSCLSRKYNIRTNAFSIMPNHTHSQQEAESSKAFIAFNQELNSTFTRGYNQQHKRKGVLFMKPFGSVPKMGAKYIKNNLSYINNNGAEGNLSKGVLDYRWNLMAYYGSDHPFSEHITLRNASKRMRWAVKYVDSLRKKEKPIDYKTQEILFKGLNRKERKQLQDYIIVQYNFLDYNSVIRHFGSFEDALMGMDANTGSEYDIAEEWEDYSEYRKMIETAYKAGYDMDNCNFRLLEKDKLFDLILLLSRITGDKKKIHRFLQMGDVVNKTLIDNEIL